MASAGQVLRPKEGSVHVITTLDALKQDKSARYERFTLSQMEQKDTESIDKFCRRITQQVDKCRKITEVDKCKMPETWRAMAIVDALIAGTKHKEIQKKLIQRDTLTLGEALKELKQEETKAEQQAANEKDGDKERRKKMKGHGETYLVGAASLAHFGGTAPDDIVKRACHMYLEIQGAKTYLAARVSSVTECNVIPLADFAYLFPSKVTPDGLPKPGVVEPNAAVLITTYGPKLDHYGTVRLTGIYDGKEMPLEFFIVKNELYGIIGMPTIDLMGAFSGLRI